MVKPVSTVLLAASLLLGNSPAQSAELLILEQKGCAWCQRWNEEIAPVYPKTVLATRAPLRRVDIDKPWPEDLSNIRKEVFTPTFVLIEEGEEIARMRGYSGDEFFWFLLEEMLSKLDHREQSNRAS